jgi:YD repeat-containing protein
MLNTPSGQVRSGQPWIGVRRMAEADVTGSAGTDRTVAYTFDAAGNRTDVAGDACPGNYTQTGSDALVNQYTTTPCENWQHDLAGNMTETTSTAAGGRSLALVYDHRNRLVEATNASGVQLLFAYDAARRLVGNRLRIRCRTNAGLCSEKNGDTNFNKAWTKRNNWHAAIRMCRDPAKPGWGFHKALGTGLPAKSDWWFSASQGHLLVHEVAHNIGPVPDHAYIGITRRQGFNLSGQHVTTTPRQASYNADTYARCGVDCFLRGC